MKNSLVQHPLASGKPVVLVTGASGLIGKRVIDRLADNYQCIGLDKVLVLSFQYFSKNYAIPWFLHFHCEFLKLIEIYQGNYSSMWSICLEQALEYGGYRTETLCTFILAHQVSSPQHICIHNSAQNGVGIFLRSQITACSFFEFFMQFPEEFEFLHFV